MMVDMLSDSYGYCSQRKFRFVPKTPFLPFQQMMIGAVPIFLIYSNVGGQGQTKQIDWINRYQLLMDCKKNID
jgi:hypothetical protein